MMSEDNKYNLDDLIDNALRNRKYVARFWACPDCVGSSIKWIGSIAICQSCNLNNMKPDEPEGE